MAAIMGVLDKVRGFTLRLREFLTDVTRTGLQRQFESVCENIGLIAFLLQSEPKAAVAAMNVNNNNNNNNSSGQQIMTDAMRSVLV